MAKYQCKQPGAGVQVQVHAKEKMWFNANSFPKEKPLYTRLVPYDLWHTELTVLRYILTLLWNKSAKM